MKFVSHKRDPETQVHVTLERDELHLYVEMNEILVAFFADGVLNLCHFGPASKEMYALEAEGVQFERGGAIGDNYYQLKIRR